MIYQCKICGEEFNYVEEVLRINCNGEYHTFSLEELEVNAQDPDYCIGYICNECAELNEN